MDRFFKLNPGVKRATRFIIKKSRQTPPVLWLALFILCYIGPLAQVKNYFDYINRTPQEQVRTEVVKKNEFVSSAQSLFVKDKNRERFVQQLLTYGIPKNEAFTMMNSVKEFQDKTKNKIASSEYADTRRNSVFSRAFGAPVLSLDGFFVNEEKTMTRNGLILLESPNSDTLVDGTSYRNLLKKVKNNKNLKLTATEKKTLENVREARYERERVRERAKSMRNPSIPRYLFCGGEQELDLFLRFFVSNSIDTFSLDILEGLKFFDSVSIEPKLTIPFFYSEEDSLESQSTSRVLGTRNKLNIETSSESLADADFRLKIKKDAKEDREALEKKAESAFELEQDNSSMQTKLEQNEARMKEMERAGSLAQDQLRRKNLIEEELREEKRQNQAQLANKSVTEDQLKKEVETLKEEISQRNFADSCPPAPTYQIRKSPSVSTSNEPSDPRLTPPSMACLSLGLRGGASPDWSENSYDVHSSDEEDTSVLESVAPGITVSTFFTSPAGWCLAFLFWVLSFTTLVEAKPGSALKEMIRFECFVRRVQTDYRQRYINYTEAYDLLSLDCGYSERQIKSLLETEDLPYLPPLPFPSPPPKPQRKLNQLGFVVSGFVGFSILIWVLQVLSTS